MHLFAGEQIPDHVESAIDNLTDDADSNKDIIIEPVHEIYNNVVYATSKASVIRAFASRLSNYDC